MNSMYVILATPLVTILFFLIFSRWIKENLKPSEKYITIPIALTAFVMSIYSFQESRETSIKIITPALQVVPESLSIADNIKTIDLTIKIINYSLLKNVF